MVAFATARLDATAGLERMVMAYLLWVTVDLRVAD
jgi:hypothetical protein